MAIGTARFRTAVSSALVFTLIAMTLPPLEAAAVEPAAQTDASARTENIQTVINGGLVTVTYDLVAPAARPVSVTLEISQDGGQTYAFVPRSIAGDVGPGVTAGRGKKIVWEASKDTDRLQLDGFRFRVAVSPAAAPAQPVTMSPPAPPTSSRQPNVTSGAKSQAYLWPSVGMMAGGLVIGVMGAWGPLGRDNPDYLSCLDANPVDLCRRAAGPTHIASAAPIVAGLAILAAGSAAFLIGRAKAARLPSITTTQGGFLISKTVQF